MKKAYIQPAMMLVETGAEVMICVSDPKLKGSQTQQNSGNLTKSRGGIFDSGDASESAKGIW